MRALGGWLLALAAGPALALEPGERLPSLVLARIDQTGTLQLDALRGKVAYVDFWASWCVPCRLSMPALDALQKRHGARGFMVVGINKDTTTAEAQRFLKRVPVGFVLVSDEKDAAAKAFDVKAMPSGYLVDREGTVLKVHRGFTTETAAVLEREIEEALRERS